MAVRMKDIAAELGVSIVTVSKALRHHPDIAKATRERVLQRVKELNYRPNLMARSLVTGRSSLVGMVVPDLIHPFFSEICKSLSLALRDAGYFLIVSSSDGEAELERAEIEHMLAHKLDALVVASSQERPDALRAVLAQGTPLILVDRSFTGFACNFVGSDDHQVGKIATEHLIATGRRRIAHIRGPENSVGKARNEGYRNAMKDHGLPVNEAYVVAPYAVDVDGRTTGKAAMKKLLAMEPRPDAVFCFNDNIAVGVMGEAFEAGLRVPQDLAVIGCGNYHYGDILRVPLSTVEQSSEEMGRKVAKMILSAVAPAGTHARTRRLLLPPTLVARESTAPVR